MDERKISPATRIRILGLVNTTDGSQRSLSEIARLCGCNRKTVREILNAGKAYMALPINDPNECLSLCIEDLRAFLATRTLPSGLDSVGHAATVVGALAHRHGVGVLESSPATDAKLRELSNVLGVEAPKPEGVGGPLISILGPLLLKQLLPILIQMIQQWISQQG